MSKPITHHVTRLLLAWGGGDEAASEQLLPLVYEELRQLARAYMRTERGDHTLQPTALVHEAYLRLVDAPQIDWRSRSHFYGIAARLMRRILVDHARARAAEKRGGKAERVPFDDLSDLPQDESVDLIALDGALDGLARSYPRPRDVVELRFFGGLTTREIGEVLQTSESTVERDWEFALLWLKRELAHGANTAVP